VTVTPAIRRSKSDQGLSWRARAADGGCHPAPRRDVIVGLTTPRASATDLSTFFDDLRPGEAFRIWVERNGQTAYTDLVYR
jgi:hypothetical protein